MSRNNLVLGAWKFNCSKRAAHFLFFNARYRSKTDIEVFYLTIINLLFICSTFFKFVLVHLLVLGIAFNRKYFLSDFLGTVILFIHLFNYFFFSVLRSAPDFHTLRLPAAKNISADTICQLMQLTSLKFLEIHNNRGIWKSFDDSIIADAVTRAASDALERLALRDPPEALTEAWSIVKGAQSVTKTGAFGLKIFEAVNS